MYVSSILQLVPTPLVLSEGFIQQWQKPDRHSSNYAVPSKQECRPVWSWRTLGMVTKQPFATV
jgi:hypothetical protein